jgi:hypothetical protein
MFHLLGRDDSVHKKNATSSGVSGTSDPPSKAQRLSIPDHSLHMMTPESDGEGQEGGQRDKSVALTQERVVGRLLFLTLSDIMRARACRLRMHAQALHARLGTKRE